MDNKPNPDKQGKTPKNGQTLLILVVAAVITFFSITWMRDMMMASTTKELPYTEFIQMLEDGKVDTVEVGGSEITIHPKKEAEGYSQVIRYYTVRMESSDQLTQRLVKAGVEGRQEKQDTSMILESIPQFSDPVCDHRGFHEFHDEAYGRRGYGLWKEQCPHLYAERNRDYF